MKKYRKLKSLKFLYEITNDGTVRNVKSKKILRPYTDKDGQLRLTFYNVCLDNVHTKKFVHQLVMEAWGPEKPDWATSVDHIDRNRKNNSISNLRWADYKLQAKNRDSRDNDTEILEKMWDFTRSLKTKPVSNGITAFKSSWEAAEYVKELYKLDSKLQTIACRIRQCVNGKRKEAYNFKWKEI